MPIKFHTEYLQPHPEKTLKKEVRNSAFTSSHFVKINVERDRDIKLVKGQDRPRLFYNSLGNAQESEQWLLKMNVTKEAYSSDKSPHI